MKKGQRVRRHITLGDIINIMVLLLFTFLCFYPFWYIFIGTISNPNIPVCSVTLLPQNLTLFNYIEVFQSEGLLPAVGVSVARTVPGTFLGTAVPTMLSNGGQAKLWSTPEIWKKSLTPLQKDFCNHYDIQVPVEAARNLVVEGKAYDKSVNNTVSSEYSYQTVHILFFPTE